MSLSKHAETFKWQLHDVGMLSKQMLTCCWKKPYDFMVNADQADMAATPDSMQGSESSEETTAVKHQQEVSSADIQTYAAFYQSRVFVTSAKTGVGVKQLFSAIAEDLAVGATEQQAPRLKHQHTVRPVSPNYLQRRSGPGSASPSASHHNSTYSRTKRKYLPSCCC